MGTVALIGLSRSGDYERIQSLLAGLDVHKAVSCGLTPLDVLSEEFAEEKSIPVVRVELKVTNMDVPAHLARDLSVIDKCDEVVALTDGQSREVECAIEHARKLGKQVYVVHI